MQKMLINYAPGEGCRIAITENGQLEEFLAEHADHVSRVGNIYLGTVTNVEPAIQAAFIDFGLEQQGFLHSSDVHPQYFPGEDEETTERVGKKTPRRDRPPIQQCFKKGQRVLVQVLKEGVGTKGPTLTSYLSIPGRFLVMMPQMDRVGVSRKVEDEDLRRKMREILDQLDLPDGFGFILRTAGMDRTKTELKRDLAYLQRLWKGIEKAKKTKSKGPLLLYAESDLLVRTLRDLLTSEMGEIVIDHPQALHRAAQFLKIVSPRSSTKLMHYTGKLPIFEAFDIEQQVLNIHARDVPLPSGGRLVIDETEALVAIDVNSGKSRKANDAETNAFNTNMEAVDVICRQLKLRDLGGLVICDLIDMRHRKNRQAVEARFKERLKNDRSRASFLPISDYGILEMTRQRQRSSHEKVHFTECPTCHGRGLVQRPDSIAADAVRQLAAVLAIESVARVEMAVSPRVAGDLLSARRRTLTRMELLSGKRVDVRVSSTLAVDRTSFYAYDADGADIDLSRIKKPKDAASKVEQWTVAVDDEEAMRVDVSADAELELLTQEPKNENEAEPHPIEIDPADLADDEEEQAQETAATNKKRKRRRKRGKKSQDTPAEASSEQKEDEPSAEENAGAAGGDGEATDAPAKKKRRRRRKKKSGQGSAAEAQSESASDAAPSEDESAAADTDVPEPAAEPDQQDAKKPSRSRRSRSRRKSPSVAEHGEQAETALANDAETTKVPAEAGTASEPVGDNAEQSATRSRRKRRSRNSKKSEPKTESSNQDAVSDAQTSPKKQAEQSTEKTEIPIVNAKPKVRSLYSSRRKLSASEGAKLKGRRE
ncbi:MAG: Rne/Rng family ribonuclease [Phycisphaeraceae bacterium]|nr:Rne/Rng family ribonuclease [Phycisphaerales bacterium]MCB9859968.1 Rne/Rng family ribonuclease [Phycisphaeraceae bacterium]